MIRIEELENAAEIRKAFESIGETAPEEFSKRDIATTIAQALYNTANSEKVMVQKLVNKLMKQPVNKWVHSYPVAIILLHAIEKRVSEEHAAEIAAETYIEGGY